MEYYYHITKEFRLGNIIVKTHKKPHKEINKHLV